MRSVWVWILVACFAAGCSSPPIVESTRRNRNPNAGKLCGDTADCGYPYACIDGSCQLDPCIRGFDTCGGGEECRAMCWYKEDPCTGVECEGGETCIQGICVEGCYYRSQCANIECGEGLICDPRSGLCVAENPCDADCGNKVCQLGCGPPVNQLDPCDFITCDNMEFCWNGECITNPCEGVDCPLGQICNNGECIDTCGGGCADGCFGMDYCAVGTCLPLPCAPTCKDALCGDDDGCGGLCDGPCLDGLECHRGECVTCIPDCDGKGCGMDDGCGNSCSGSCSNGGRCIWKDDAFKCCNPNCGSNSCGKQDGCGGICRECTGDKLCQNDGSEWFCGCKPDCQGKACGANNGCGGKCKGTCSAGKTCNPTTYTCELSECGTPCSCTEICASGSCVSKCAPGSVICGCDCCAPGSSCKAGTCADIVL